MAFWSRAQQVPATFAPAVGAVKGMSNLTRIGLVTVLLLVAAIVALSWSGALRTSHGQRSVTVTAPQSAPDVKPPTITLPNVDSSTQAELQVLAAGAGWDGWWKAATLWLVNRLFWPALFGLVLGTVVYAFPLFPDEWGVRLGLGSAIVMVASFLVPILVTGLVALQEVRNQAISPVAGP